jgi:hypothetical protein
MSKSSKPLPKMPKSPRKSWGWLGNLTALIIILSLGGTIGYGAWIAIQYIIAPEKVKWVNPYLPEWTKQPVANDKSDQTLEQITEELKKKKLLSGEEIKFSDSDKQEYLLIPINKKDSKQIVSLRLYQQNSENKKYYKQINQIDIDNYAGQNGELLPLTKIIRLEGNENKTGIWFNIYGQIKDKTPLNYGKILNYNPEENNLNLMLDWNNQNDDLPYWQQVTGNNLLELVINHTKGLYPNLQVFKLKDRKFVGSPYELTEIYINQPEIVDKVDNKFLKDYRNALNLAKNGLWTAAFNLLETLKNTSSWTEEAQDQLDVIKLHSDLTESQAYKNWEQVHQQFIANLINCSWKNAILSFQSADENQRYKIAKILKDDDNAQVKGIEIALEIYPKNTDLQTLFAMILSAKYGYEKAMLWVNKQSDNSAEIQNKIKTLVSQIDDTFLVQKQIPSHPSQIVAVAETLIDIDSTEWSQPQDNLQGNQAPLELGQLQGWYQVEVTEFFDGQNMRKQPFNDLRLTSTNAVKYLWKLLGLETDPRLQITIAGSNGQQQSTLVEVKAAKIKDGKLYLLAVGEKLLN